jgi:hypothetical protein
MPLRKFHLITRYLRIFDYTKVDVREERDLLKVSQAANPWSDWKPYTTLKDWKECIYNAIFNTYTQARQGREIGQGRKRTLKI